MLQLSDILPSDRKERIKFIAAAGVTAVCLLWLIIWMASTLGGGGDVALSGPREPGLKIAAELSEKLLENQEFNDVGFAVESEKPLKFKVVGVVHSDAAMNSLRQRVAELRPEGDYEFDVLVHPR